VDRTRVLVSLLDMAPITGDVRLGYGKRGVQNNCQHAGGFDRKESFHAMIVSFTQALLDISRTSCAFLL
jgi:hypothetical protein